MKRYLDCYREEHGSDVIDWTSRWWSSCSEERRRKFQVSPLKARIPNPWCNWTAIEIELWL